MNIQIEALESGYVLTVDKQRFVKESYDDLRIYLQEKLLAGFKISAGETVEVKIEHRRVEQGETKLESIERVKLKSALKRIQVLTAPGANYDEIDTEIIYKIIKEVQNYLP